MSVNPRRYPRLVASKLFLFPPLPAPDSALPAQQSNLWFNNEAVKHRVETTSLISGQPLPINSIDSLGTSLVAAGDNEVVYCVANLVV